MDDADETQHDQGENEEWEGDSDDEEDSDISYINIEDASDL